MTLKYTPDQVRDREAAAIGTKGLPTPWWPGTDPAGNDCMAFQTLQLGLRTGTETLGDLDRNRHFISIAAFRAHYGYDEPAVADIDAGDLACWNFSGQGHLPEHIEYVYSVDHTARTITTISANTSPEPGVPITIRNRGVWKKTRPITKSLLFGIRLPYLPASAVASKARKEVVKFIAAYLNHLPELDHLDNTRAEEDGDPGKVYWRLVQTWGRLHDLYGPTYIIDGIPLTRSREVEKAAYQAAKAATAKR